MLYNFQILFSLEVFINMELKICSICKKNIPATDEFFAKKIVKTRETLQSNCRECQKEYRKKHYENNKKKYILKAKNYRNIFAEWFRNLKINLSCEKCGEDRYWVLDFHHVDPKTKDFDVSVLVNKCSKNLLLKEIDKCIVLCANCHRDFHYHENNISR